MRVRVLSLGVLTLVLALPVFAHNDPQPPNDFLYAGSSRFGDQNCIVCHNGSALNASTGSIKILFNGQAATTYVPGTTVPINVQITDTQGPVRRVWGFELVARFSNGKSAGVL